MSECCLPRFKAGDSRTGSVAQWLERSLCQCLHRKRALMLFLVANLTDMRQVGARPPRIQPPFWGGRRAGGGGGARGAREKRSRNVFSSFFFSNPPHHLRHCRRPPPALAPPRHKVDVAQPWQDLARHAPHARPRQGVPKGGRLGGRHRPVVAACQQHPPHASQPGRPERQGPAQAGAGGPPPGRRPVQDGGGRAGLQAGRLPGRGRARARRTAPSLPRRCRPPPHPRPPPTPPPRPPPGPWRTGRARPPRSYS